MGQTYPAPITRTMVARADDGTPRTIPPATDATLATSTVAYTPKVWSEKAANHKVGDPDYVNVVRINDTNASNTPY